MYVNEQFQKIPWHPRPWTYCKLTELKEFTIEKSGILTTDLGLNIGYQMWKVNRLKLLYS